MSHGMREGIEMLLHPKRFKIKDVFGVEKEYIFSLMPATVALDFQAKAPSSFLTKSVEISQIHDLRDMIFQHVAVEIDGQETILSTPGLIDNHVMGGVQIAGIVAMFLEYNFNFFGNAGGSGLLGSLAEKAASWIIPMLTPLLERLSALDLPHTEN